MAAASQDQIDNILASIKALNTYIKRIQDAMIRAANNNKDADAMRLNSKFNEANTLETNLNNTLIITSAESLSAALNSVKIQADHLQHQKEEIDQVVKGVGIAAGILGLLASIAANIAKL
jgi:CRISPR/Cas system-associated protein Csm6